jgi:glyoxylase-like metal-dependent hydrolase (beta-lactamase superfamily II)
MTLPPETKEGQITAEVTAAAPPAPILREDPVEIGQGVFVIPDGRVPLVPNVGIVLGKRDALVVDTAMGPGNGARVLEHARTLAGDRRLLVTSTHFHPEHAYGMQAFVGAATIVYNRTQLEELHAKGRDYIEMFRGFGETVAAQLEGVELVEPHVAYNGPADLDLGGRRVHLRPTGLAHTRGDQIVFLPEERIVFTGDLVETRAFPIFPYFPPGDADVSGLRWIETLASLESLEPATVVPGHGEIGGAGLIGKVREELELVQAETERLAAEGLDDDDVVAALAVAVRSRYPDWDAPEWIAFAGRCFLDELRDGA